MTYEQRARVIWLAVPEDKIVETTNKAMDKEINKLSKFLREDFYPGCKDWDNPGKASYKQKWLRAHGVEL